MLIRRTCLTGDVSGGPLPATLTFDNATGFNDYFGGFTFGTTISFDVTLYGSALSAPDGVSTSGSTFGFAMFFDPAGTFPILTKDTTGGFAFMVAVNLDGTTTVNSFPAGTGGVIINAVALNACDVTYGATATVADAQLMVNEALGLALAANDLNGDGVVNVADVQTVINSALGLGCSGS
jgi:hypothetical protein